MKDPKRLRQSGTDQLTARLLYAGRSEAPSAERLARLLGGTAAVGASLAVTSAAATVAAAESSVPVALVAKWLGLGALVGALASVGAVATLSARGGAVIESEAPDRPRAPVPTGRAAARPRASAPPVALEPPVPSALPLLAPRSPGFARERAVEERRSASAQTTAESPAGTKAGTEGAASASEVVASREVGAVHEEVAALGLAKASLNRGSSADALALVRRYHARFPQGRLKPEATYLEMEAELASGNRGRALEIAARLAGGSTPNAKRARALLHGEAR
jgi:hypothetical protein